MKRTPSTPHNVVTIDPAQSTRCVFGLRDRPRFMPCALGRDLQLAQMDAPDLLPAGSMTATEYADGPRLLMESNVRRGASVCITASNWDRACRMSDAPTQTFPDGARVRIKPLNLVGKIAGFAHVGCNGQMRVLVDRPHGQGVLRQHFDEDDLELVRE